MMDFIQRQTAWYEDKTKKIRLTRMAIALAKGKWYNAALWGYLLTAIADHFKHKNRR